jgi:hypothetical protein
MYKKSWIRNPGFLLLFFRNNFMDIATVQLAKWRKLKPLNFELIDTTVKSGIKAFAPTWRI